MIHYYLISKIHTTRTIKPFLELFLKLLVKNFVAWTSPELDADNKIGIYCSLKFKHHPRRTRETRHMIDVNVNIIQLTMQKGLHNICLTYSVIFSSGKSQQDSIVPTRENCTIIIVRKLIAAKELAMSPPTESSLGAPPRVLVKTHKPRKGRAPGGKGTAAKQSYFWNAAFSRSIAGPHSSTNEEDRACCTFLGIRVSWVSTSWEKIWSGREAV